MLKFITDFLNAKNERKMKQQELSLKMIETSIAMASKIVEMQLAVSQNKCNICVHQFEKFKEGGVVYPKFKDENKIQAPKIKNIHSQKRRDHTTNE